MDGSMVVTANGMNRNTLLWVFLHGEVVLGMLPVTLYYWDVGLVVGVRFSV
jgi:hypothetical protein